MGIELNNITKRYGQFTALTDIRLSIPTGELVALLGPSGSGKTTLLRIIAGLEAADSGSVVVDGHNIASKSPRERRVGFVFQHYALFRHMTVFENVAFGLRVRPRRQRPGREEIRERVMTLLKLVQLENLAQRYPSQLSGGQRQRVALARALAVEPSVLLLDEPFGALDARVRKELRRWLRRLHDEIQLTSVFVTHDQEEALEVSDRIVVVNEGKIEQVGTPDEVYRDPASAFVYQFLGNVNLFHARIEDGKPVLGSLGGGKRGEDAAPEAQVFVRSHSLDVHTHRQGNEMFGARVEHISPAGPFVKLELKATWGDYIEVSISRERFQQLELRKNSDVFLAPREMQVFADNYVI